MEKMEAHEKGLLHRAFSILVFNDAGELLLQQRALNKYHSAGLWTNTCCSHPRNIEPTEQAAHRRLFEEMGFDCTLTEQFSFIYKAAFDNGLIEHELDFVYTGIYHQNPNINKEEVSAYKWMPVELIEKDAKENPQLYTAWFLILINKYSLAELLAAAMR
jgi:isopentenyl-diphosphate delta-isomerase